MKNMKKLLIAACLFAGLSFTGQAQKSKVKEMEHKKEMADKKAAKEKRRIERVAEKKVKAAEKAGRPVKKNGEPDMRYKENQRKAPAVKPRNYPAPPEVRRPLPPVASRNYPQPTNKTPDRVVATDSKGRTIYEGPRGGRYYINKNGNKEYIKQ